jgi:hypothetical protein
VYKRPGEPAYPNGSSSAYFIGNENNVLINQPLGNYIATSAEKCLLVKSENMNYIWNGQQVIAAAANMTHETWGELGSACINDQADYLYHTDDGTPYFAQGTSTTEFKNILPEEYRKQLRTFENFLISNREESSDFPIIQFSAEVLEGPPPGEWVGRTFRLSKDGSSETVLAALSSAPGAPSDTADGTSKQINKNGTEIIPADNLESPKLRVNWAWRERKDTVFKGFDPAMTGDFQPTLNQEQKPVLNNGVAEGVLDYEQGKSPEDYASVVRTGPGKVNSAVELQFGSESIGKICKLVIPSASANLIDVSPKNTALQPVQDIYGKWVVPFDITSKSNSTSFDKENATIELRTADTKETLLGVLKVIVFPEIKLKVAIHRVQDPVSMQHPDQRTKLPLNLPTNEQIIAHMNEVFQQAGVTFELQRDERAL